MIRKLLFNPGPATTTQSVKEAMVVPDICPRESEFGQLLEGIQRDLVRVVHGDDTHACVLFTASGTGGLEAAITSAVPKGKKLLVVENGAYGTRMHEIALTYGIETVRYTLSYGDYPKVEEIASLLEAHTEVSHLAVVHHETTTGMLNPVEEICRVAHARGVEVIVDAMSSYAGIPIDIRQWKAEYLVSSSNKCIQGMPGLVFVIFKKDLLEKIRGNKRSYYLDIYSQYVGFNKSGQMQFTPPVQVAYALRQAIDEYVAETEAGRWARYSSNWERLYKGLESMGFSFLLPFEQQSRILLAVKDPADPRFDFNDMHDYLFARDITIYPRKGAKESTFRLSVLGDLHEADIRHFLAEMEGYLRLRNLKVVG
jgi:2-aminoethylphosphonate aminotransferase